jgi:cobalamin biosynthesis protein CbiG
MTVASGTSGVHYAITVLRQEVKVQLTLDHPDAERITRMFDYLHDHKPQIEEKYSAPIL